MTRTQLVENIKKALTFEGHSIERRWMEVQGLIAIYDKSTKSQLTDWLRAERLENDGAMINAKQNGEWDRLHHLEGHSAALLHVINHILAV